MRFTDDWKCPIAAALLLLVLTIGCTSVPAAATLQNGTTNEMGDPPLALGGGWIILDQSNMHPGDFFAGSYTWNSASLVKFTITDLYVVSDRFEVYDFGTKVATTPALPDWDALGLGSASLSPPWTSNPAQALADGRFSNTSILFKAGAHEITITDIHIPNGFTDGTVAFRADAVPEPSGLLALISGVGGLAGLMFRRRR
jgi:hypothetical protein